MDTLQKIIDVIAEEVVKKLPPAKEVSTEELTKNIEVLLENADWFKSTVKECVSDEISLEDFHHDAAKAGEKAAEEAINSADIDRQVEDKIEEHDFSEQLEKVVANYDFDSAIEDALDDFDFSSAVEDAVDDKIVDALAEVEKRIEALEKFKERLAAAIENAKAVKPELVVKEAA